MAMSSYTCSCTFTAWLATVLRTLKCWQRQHSTTNNYAHTMFGTSLPTKSMELMHHNAITSWMGNPAGSSTGMLRCYRCKYGLGHEEFKSPRGLGVVGRGTCVSEGAHVKGTCVVEFAAWGFGVAWCGTLLSDRRWRGESSARHNLRTMVAWMGGCVEPYD